MTRWQPVVTRYAAPSYYEHASRLKADHAVIYGPHLDMDPDDPNALRDPFKVARPFAHAMAMETGEPFAWGWYDSSEGLRPAVCAVEELPRTLRAVGRTDRLTGNVP